MPPITPRKAFAPPNIMTTVRSGDFEAVTTYGIGLARQNPLPGPRGPEPESVAIDVGAGFRTVGRKVFFFNRDRFVAARQPFFTPVSRPVPASTPATRVMDRLFAGPLTSERANGLPLLRSEGTGFSHLKIYDWQGNTERPTGRSDSIPECLEALIVHAAPSRRIA